jgi:hypothetical protein
LYNCNGGLLQHLNNHLISQPPSQRPPQQSQQQLKQQQQKNLQWRYSPLERDNSHHPIIRRHIQIV